MHSLVAAFYAMIFALGHTAAPHHPTPAAQPFIESPTYLPAGLTPSRQQLAAGHYTNFTPVSSCVSCRRMNISYPTH